MRKHPMISPEAQLNEYRFNKAHMWKKSKAGNTQERSSLDSLLKITSFLPRYNFMIANGIMKQLWRGKHKANRPTCGLRDFWVYGSLRALKSACIMSAEQSTRASWPTERHKSLRIPTAAKQTCADTAQEEECFNTRHEQLGLHPKFFKI